MRSTRDDVLHAVSIPAYETQCWKEDSKLFSLPRGGFCAGFKQNLTARHQSCVASVLFAKSGNPDLNSAESESYFAGE